MRRLAFYALEVLTIFLLLTGAQVLVGAEESCSYVWHDHYKTNYRKRHKHKVCGSVANHYINDDDFRVMQLYFPDLYITEVPEREEDRVTLKNLKKLLQNEKK